MRAQTPSNRRSSRGILLVVCLFILGGLVLFGFFQAPHLRPIPAPTGLGWGAPIRPLRFVSYNILHNQRGADGITAEIRKLAPDIVCLQEVEDKDVIDLAAALDMQRYYHPALYQRSENLAGRRASWGNLILSKVPIYDAAAIPNPGGGIFGVWATAVVDDRKFLVANLHLSATWNANPLHIKQSGEARSKELSALITAWQNRGSSPIVVTGDFNQIPTGNNYARMTENFTDALAQLRHTGATFDGGPLLQTRIDYFLLSPDFTPIEGGIVNTNASDHRPIWLTARSTRLPATSSPTTR